MRLQTRSDHHLLRTPLTRRQTLLALAAVAAAPALGSAWPRAVAGQEVVTLTLVAYSTPREAYEAIIPLFQATPEGAGVKFETSFAASGEQSRAVENGLPADVVAFSLEPDITRLIARRTRGRELERRRGQGDGDRFGRRP